MFSKIAAVIALVILPFNVLLWYQSHRNPYFQRFDVTLYKSLWVYMKDGVCCLNLLNMPTRTASRTTFETPLNYNPAPAQRSFYINSQKKGPYRVSWLVFPFWLPAALLVMAGIVPLAAPPTRIWWRRSKGRCVVCAYDLTANRSGRCPECGNRLG